MTQTTRTIVFPNSAETTTNASQIQLVADVQMDRHSHRVLCLDLDGSAGGLVRVWE